MEEIKRFSKYWKELKNSFFLLDLSKAASNAGTLSRNCTLGEFIFRFHLIGKPRRFRFHFQGGVSNFRTSGVLLNRGLLGPVEPADPPEPVKPTLFCKKKRNFNDIVKDEKQTYYSLTQSFLYPKWNFEQPEKINDSAGSAVPEVPQSADLRFSFTQTSVLFSHCHKTECFL